MSLANREAEVAIADLEMAIALCKMNIAYLQNIGLEVKQVEAYRRVVAYLEVKLKSRVHQPVGKPAAGKARRRPDEPPLLTDEEIAKLTGDEVVTHLHQEKLPRLQIERLAAIRFSVTRGALSTLRTRAALIEKLMTLVANERTHDSISRAVRSEENGR
jgi:hypothetical protein